MKCDICQKNEANLRMNLQLNNKLHKLHLCSDCYSMGLSKAGMPNNFGSFFNMWGSSFPPANGEEESVQNRSKHSDAEHSVLDEVGRNLSVAAKAGLIDPVIGREEEVERVIEILNRRTKNNPVLIGEAGVGKTAIAEGLAQKIAEGNVPSKLLGKVVYTLDVASLVAGTGYRGQFEEKMKQIMAELQKRKNIILFIDEIHLLVGAGSAQGSMDAGNILKPALARGELQVIGATTLKEYRQIEKDPALERRFQPVMVKEPSVEQAIEILKGLRSKYEEYHEVRYSDEVLQACVQLSHRYIQDRFLPDKAIDLLDEAGSKISLRNHRDDSKQIHLQLQTIAEEKKKAMQDENYEQAAVLRDQEAELQKRLDGKTDKSEQVEVTVADIEGIIEKMTGIPVRKLQQDEQGKMRNLAERLANKVIGQDVAVEKVAKAIRRSRTGLRPKNRPIASFLFIGPTGVGKTELSKSLAEEMFGQKDAMIRLDMSEYMEKHSVSKLIGSPPGYVGHEEAGQLTERVRRNPYSIILLDEIEKAHPDVQNMFLQILEDGRLTDSQGRTVNFKDTVIIMTSNAGVAEKRAHIGFGAKSENIFISNLDSYFRPEFLNRFDQIITFRSLETEDLMKIVELLLEETKANVREQGMMLEVSDAAKEKLAELGYHPAFGARPLRRVIQEQLEDKLADLLLEENDEPFLKVKIDLVDGEISVQKA